MTSTPKPNVREASGASPSPRARSETGAASASSSVGPGGDIPVVAAVIAVVLGLTVGFVVSGEAMSDPRVAMLMLAGPVAAALGVLAVTRFEWFVLLVLAVRPSLDILGVGGLGPGAMLATVFVATAALWLIVQYRSGHWQPMSLAAKCLVAFGGATVLSVVTSSLRVISATGALEIVAGISMFLVLEQLLANRPDRVRRLLLAVLLSGIVPVIVGVNQWIGADVASARSDLSRIQGTFVHPNPFATYLVMLILLSTSLVTVVAGRQRLMLLCYLAVLGLMLVVTYNRASWIAVIVGLTYIGVTWNRRILAVMGLGLVIVVLAVPSVGARIGDLSEEKALPEGVPDNSLEWRIQYWEKLVPLANDSPLTGIGPQVVLHTRPERVEPHNIYVQAYVEMGAFGLVALGAVVVGIGITLSRRRRAAVGSFDQALAVGAIAVSLAVLAQSPSENLLNQTMSWWYMAACSTWGFSRVVRSHGTAGAASRRSVPARSRRASHGESP